MEPNKLEQDFKNKLEQRTIEPSAMAWDRLDAMLSVSEKKKQPKRRAWMYVAASFLGFMLVGAILLKQEKENTGNATKTTVVNVDQPAEKTEQNTIEEQENIKVDELPVNTTSNNAIATTKQKKNVIEQVRCSILYVPKRQDSNPIVHEEAVAIEQINRSPANEPEQLLASSMNDNPAKKKSSIKVNASSLLSSVEGELDNSFRNEVLQKVVKNYNTVKTSVANRNYEHR